MSLQRLLTSIRIVVADASYLKTQFKPINDKANIWIFVMVKVQWIIQRDNEWWMKRRPEFQKIDFKRCQFIIIWNKTMKQTNFQWKVFVFYIITQLKTSLFHIFVLNVPKVFTPEQINGPYRPNIGFLFNAFFGWNRPNFCLISYYLITILLLHCRDKHRVIDPTMLSKNSSLTEKLIENIPLRIFLSYHRIRNEITIS